MPEPYIGEIRCFGFNFAPQGWALCQGQLVAISQNTTLFQLLGTTYGGDGTNTFALPDLRGRAPMHWGTGPSGFNTSIGQVQGTTAVTLTSQQIPQHTHTLTAQVIGSGGVVERTPTPSANTWLSASAPDGIWLTTTPADFNAFSAQSIGPAGGSQPHDNMQPFLAMNFSISLFGIFPSQN